MVYEPEPSRSTMPLQERAEDLLCSEQPCASHTTRQLISAILQELLEIAEEESRTSKRRDGFRLLVVFGQTEPD